MVIIPQNKESFSEITGLDLGQIRFLSLMKLEKRGPEM